MIVVNSPADAIIGKYLLKVVAGSSVYCPENNFIYVLFNPWCKGNDHVQRALFSIATVQWQWQRDVSLVTLFIKTVKSHSMMFPKEV